MFTESSESPDLKGLDLIKGSIRKLNCSAGQKIPNIGWYKMIARDGDPVGIGGEHPFYFCHSYHANPISYDCFDWVMDIERGHSLVLGAFRVKNLYGFQCHPEKSAVAGALVVKAILDDKI